MPVCNHYKYSQKFEPICPDFTTLALIANMSHKFVYIEHILLVCDFCHKLCITSLYIIILKQAIN